MINESIDLFRIKRHNYKRTYFVHRLLWCNVQKVPQRRSKTARIVYHDEESQIHCKKKKISFSIIK